MRARGAAAAVALIALAFVEAGCANAKAIGDLQTLYTALQAQFHETFTVNRSTNGVLTVSVETADDGSKKVIPATDRQSALRIAKFARAHYADTIGLQQITVVFTTRTDGGPLQITHTYTGGTWSISSLNAEPDPAAADSAGVVRSGIK